MSFIELLYTQCKSHNNTSLLTEMHGETEHGFSGSQVLQLASKGRGTLKERKVQPGDRVVLLSANSHRWVAADLAILGEGAVVVPMYARQNPAELVEMMHDCAPSLVLCASQALGHAVQEHWSDAPILVLSEFFEGTAVSDPPLPREPDADVTIIYTSGSTGIPKGVVLSLSNIDYMLETTRNALAGMVQPGRGEERVFHYLPFCFAGSRIMLWTQLSRGKGLFVSTDLNNLIQELKGAQPSYFLNVPILLERIKNGVEGKLNDKPAPIQWLYKSALAAWARKAKGEAQRGDRLRLKLADRLLFTRIRQQIGANLQCLICGSAPLGEDTQRWFQLVGIEVYQIYGLTETTAIVTIDQPDAVAAGRVGPAIPGIDVRIGEGEELLVRGPHIFSRYWERPEATASAFVDGWFRTGDRADVDDQGNYRIIGRVKNLLVPASGHNIAPEPIEQRIIETIAGVEQAMLVGHGRPFITAIVTGEVSTDRLKEGIAQVNANLPHYRRVRNYFLADTPFSPENGLLTANQKLRRAVIEEAYQQQVEEMYA